MIPELQIKGLALSHITVYSITCMNEVHIVFLLPLILDIGFFSGDLSSVRSSLMFSELRFRAQLLSCCRSMTEFDKIKSIFLTF